MKKIKKKVKIILIQVLKFIPFLKIIYNTKDTQTPIKLHYILAQKVLGFNRKAYWPVHFTSIILHPKNVYCGVDTNPGYMPGCYIQASDKIFIDDYTQIGPGVGIISTNHNFFDNRKSVKKHPILIGKYCWIGKNANILAGVELGDFTIVGAGAVVTKSFKKGYCVIAGNPAKIIKDLNPEVCIKYKNEIEYNGYLTHRKFISNLNSYCNMI